MSENLSKKQQKALAFRAKQKSKKRGDVQPDSVPEQDVMIEDDALTGEEGEAGPSTLSKKRKREAATSEGVDLAAEVKKGKQSAKGKGKAAGWAEDGDETGEDGVKPKKSKKEVEQRFILFVGNVGYKTTREEIANHFKEAAGGLPSVRLLTHKTAPGSKEPPKSRGIAFLELASSTAMQACLKLHHSTLNNRTINVELTAGGGGKSEARTSKIKERQERVGGQRQRREEKEREEAEANGTAVPQVQEVVDRSRQTGSSAPGQGEADGVKMRGGRRVKAKGPNAATGSNAGGQLRGWANRDASKSRQPQRGRGKFELTGANAVTVG